MSLSTEQFEKLLSVIGSNQQRRGSFTTCKVTFNGARDTETVESFLAAVSVFKSVEQIPDEDAIMSVPLILREEAATWWNGIKEQVKTWEEFISRVRHAFAPKRPGYQLYQNVVNIKQGEDELTEVFVAKKRALIAQMPEPHSETQQIDMIYGQLRYKIRVKMPRDTVNTLDALVKAARGIEQLLVEKKIPEEGTKKEEETGKVPFKKKRCTYCRLPGHSIETCRKKEKKDLASGTSDASVAKPAPKNVAMGTQAPSPSTPTFACYGCGTPGVVRSKCTTCANAKPKVGRAEVSFCSINTADVRARPIVGIAIGKITGNAYVDTCAKTSVASYALYKCLRRLGFAFQTQQLMVKLADGTTTQRDVLTVEAPVSICYRVVPTTFIVFPEARESRTLLGIGFIEDAKMVLNVPQKTWHFEDHPGDVFDLQDEDAEEISLAKMEATPIHFNPRLRPILKDVEMPEFISPLSITPRYNSIREPALPRSSICTPTTDHPSSGEPALPETSACSTHTMTYRVVPIALSPIKRKRTFDGYSPRFVDFMIRDAQIQLHGATCELSPHSKALFPSDHSHSSTDDEIRSLEVDEVSSDTLDRTQKQF
ncbi:uncharacterized protein LOC124631004 [Helicoverpa zea]|uniref:uncharacterized protein LOC124631004 n=1 Tax=Helicoverpa zea TaxID=7113 RepID=UPI001F58DE12|nr:uncharacterized protein LOC124631004 [Helicoverpa zea]